ncbi:MAG: PAS domain S-box protein [Gammaproteobacteria bacterium]|nr:PAS domain S-box protein [Gammaproteobacteria bacterium]
MSDVDRNTPRLVIGIGASAGGLEAFTAFLSAMPARTGLAFVLLPHLDPDRHSRMAELLAGHTAIPVSEARDGQPAEADHVYVLPPAKHLTIRDGTLHLAAADEPRQDWTVIDRFLRALAEDQREHAVGIILSGTGSHGTLGLKDIKLAGGMVIAQDPETAAYSQMPYSAIATGLVDLVLPPSAMPAALLDYLDHPYLKRPPAEGDEVSEALDPILAVLRTRTRFDFRSYRRSMLLRRIQRRMGLCHLETAAAYHRYLRAHPDEVNALCKDLLIGVTAFFREPEAFRVLEQRVLPALVAGSDDDTPLRVWVPACATGEEVYSLAILLHEAFEAAGRPPNVQIFATDIDKDALESARQGVYPDSIATDVSDTRLARFFQRVGDNRYRVNKELRDCVVFAIQNLIADAPFSRLDLISCRNLLIYLQPELQSKAIRLFHFSLRENGYLMLGPSESIGRQPGLFTAISKKWRIFHRTGPARCCDVTIPLTGGSLPRLTADAADDVERQPHAAGRFAELTRERLLADYAPATVLINRSYEILHFFGPTVDYLELPSGEPTRDLIAMAREGLRSRIRTAVRRALEERRTVVDGGARIRRNGRYVACTISVRPVEAGPATEGLSLVSFEDGQTASAGAAGEAPEAPTPAGGDQHVIQQLEHELKATREDLQSTIEELESANEELRAANEEIMSMNQELQSTNEELETSKEELQSVNEELKTVNAELENKVAELQRSHDDVQNLLSSTDIATVILDRDMRLKLFNPSTEKLLNLRPSDIGRFIGDFSARVIGDSLLADARRVLETLVPVEKDVWSEGEPVHQHCYLRRIVPYRSTDARIGGVVITYIDITERHRVEERLEARVAERTRELREREERLQGIMNAVIDAIVLIDQKGQIQSVNPAVEQLFGYSARELAGKDIGLLMPPHGHDAPAHPFAGLLHSGRKRLLGRRRECTGRRRDGSDFPLELTLTRIDHLGLFACVMRDLSPVRALEREAANSCTREQERIGREIHDSIGQQLTGLNMLAVSLKNDLAMTGAGENSRLNEMIQQLTALIGEARTLSRGLAPVPVGPRGLADALRHFADQVNESTSLTCTFESTHPPPELKDATAATHIFRIAQEAVNNALKHAHASRIAISLDHANGYATLAVADDGKGFDLDPIEHDVGFGLRIMHYRARILGGQLTIRNVPGNGTRVDLRIPYEESRA